MDRKHKAGFVNILGKPNAGKSTLMNLLVGERLAIVTKKAQTTRHRILGIVNDQDHQIVYSDTPGILDPAYKLHESMMNVIDEVFEDADILILIQDVNDREINETILEKVNKMEIPVLLVLNKIDTREQEEVFNTINYWQNKIKDAFVIPMSALHGFNTQAVTEKVKENLPDSPPFYDKDSLTDRSLRFFVSEIIRENILTQYRKEIPYSVEVVVNEYKDQPKIVRISAVIYMERESQRKIIIGKEGKAIKGLGISARQEIERFIDKKVFLDLSVKVSKDWRNNDQKLKSFGYPVD